MTPPRATIATDSLLVVHTRLFLKFKSSPYRTVRIRLSRLEQRTSVFDADTAHWRCSRETGNFATLKENTITILSDPMAAYVRMFTVGILTVLPF
jgi:hypothetical protein